MTIKSIKILLKMRNIYVALTTLFILSFSTSVIADDILIPFGGGSGTASSEWKFRGGNTNLDGQPWKTLSFSEMLWATGNGALGFAAVGSLTAPARTTTILTDGSTNSGGATATPPTPYTTMYFRKTLNIPSLSSYFSFKLRTQFDDAIVVWINGVEAYRSNIIASPTFATFSDGTNTTYDNGNFIFSKDLAKSLFVAGNNIIAVEIHQVNSTSTDLFFDMELTGVTTPSSDVVIFPFGINNNNAATTWSYKGGGTNLDGVAWKALAYAEPAWTSGNAALGFGANPPVRSTAILLDGSGNAGGTASLKHPTMYFRKVVNIVDPTVFAGFKIATKFDDAIIVYINGVEAYRNNITASPAMFADLATVAIANNGADTLYTTVPPSMFVAGNNIIAVEIHQINTTSSDLFFDMELTGIAPVNGTLTRGPYLQVGSQTGVTLRWRTDVPTNSRVKWGTVFGTYPNTVDSLALTTEHIVRISGLTADTKYFYTIGSTTQTLQATNTNYVLTVPPSSSTRKLRFAALGDCGTATANQIDTKNALLNYIGSNDLDALITLGDNAYYSGTDNEFQLEFFDIYKNDLLKNKKLYPAPGNHDYGNSISNTGNTGATAALSMPYHKNFSVPSAGEVGGTASGSKAYYSYDIGDVHFVSLDSYGKEDANSTKLYDTTGAQAVWLKNDLATNTKKWTVVYFHHPPYTMTSHDSDLEFADLGAIRENFIRILERFGVDLVLCGHSHGYERSYLLKNYYKANAASPSLLETDFNIATHTATANNQNGKYDGTANACAYTYNSGKYNHGSLYVVSGSAGQIGGAAAGYPHNAMYYSNNTEGGSLYFEVDSNRIDVKFVSYAGTGAGVTPVIKDQFTIFKDVNKVINVAATKNVPLNLTASWRGNYFWPDNGNATTNSVTINNSTTGNFTYTVKDASGVNCIQDVFNVTVTGVLPVSFMSFDAKLDNDKVLLNWATAQELDNKYFTIEKSTDGINFNFLAKQNAAANNNTINNYSLVDYKPANGINFYRLSQTDFSNNTIIYETRKVNVKSNNTFFVSVSKTQSQQVTVKINSDKNNQINMKVVDMMGREVLQENFMVNVGVNTKLLNLKEGMYILVISNGKEEKTSTKIVVQ
jgi:predicted MPP superfamily phosphohydrolase